MQNHSILTLKDTCPSVSVQTESTFLCKIADVKQKEINHVKGNKNFHSTNRLRVSSIPFYQSIYPSIFLSMSICQSLSVCRP